MTTLFRAYSQRVSMQCGECGNPLDANERGKTCRLCQMWPLCDCCALLHAEGVAGVKPCAGKRVER